MPRDTQNMPEPAELARFHAALLTALQETGMPKARALRLVADYSFAFPGEINEAHLALSAAGGVE